MYSVVLMVALTSGTEVTSHHHRSHGCKGYGSGCSAYSGAAYGCGGKSYAPVYGCGGYAPPVSYGCGSTMPPVAYGCGSTMPPVTYGCGGVMPGYMPPMMPLQPAEGMKEPGKKKKVPEKLEPPVKDEVSAPATVVVTLPENATLTFDGKSTVSATKVRTFVSPELVPQKTFYYTVTAEVLQNGTPVRQTMQIAVRAGQETRVRFDFTPAAVVSAEVSTPR